MALQTQIRKKKKKESATYQVWVRVKSLLISELLWITVFRCATVLPLQSSKHAKVTSR